ncbi:amino acid adenylation domain-containing protein [Chitinophagaceae bacterium LWZ2-11]
MIDKLFERQAVETPEVIALRFGEEEFTYELLNKKADELAQVILIHATDASIISVSTNRSPATIIAVLAILKAGKAYLPLDASYPQERLKQIIKDAGVDILLAPSGERFLFEGLGINFLAIDEIKEEKSQAITTSSSLVYVLYTSGSTGTPKGVCMGHAALTNLLTWQKEHSDASIGTNTLQFAPLSFDVSFQEIFATLTTGGTLVLINDELRLDPPGLLRFIEAQFINRLFLPFVALQYLTEAADAAQFYPACLTEIITAGEQLKITPHIVNFFTALPGCTLSNQYGPTESHVVTELKLQGNPALWPALPSIGTPINNTEIFIADENLQQAAQGEIGELCITGICLAEGYLNNPGLTGEKFISRQVSPDKTTRFYLTGDLARILPDGNIEYLGRKDNQVKIRGNRVELGEIEVVLNSLPGVKQAVVTVLEDNKGQKRLIAYLVSQEKQYDLLAVRKALQLQLPDYMMPSAFIYVNDLPKTSTGKIDRKALPKPDLHRPDSAVLYKAPQTFMEQCIADLWIQLLQIDKVGVNDNFFESGGNSLLALTTVATLKQEFDFNLPVTKLFQYPTVAGIAAYLEGRTNTLSETAFTGNKPHTNTGDIAVIGMAARFPGVNTLDEFWDVLKEGRETISFFREDEIDPSVNSNLKNNPDYVKARGIIDHAEEFDASFFGINPKSVALMDPQQRVFLEVAWEALESGGHIPQKYSGLIGVYAGCGNNTYYLNNVMTNPREVESVGAFQVMTLNEKDYIASRTAYELNLKGPAVSVYAACSTSLLAVTQAVNAIRSGQCDIAVAGGCSITSPIKSGHLYQAGAMLSSDGHCRPFDAEATGTVFSDGAGAVLLKSREDAERDGDTIYVIIKGVGVNNDGAGKGSFTAPDAVGQAGAITMALQDADVEPSAISYIEAHGTATPVGDPIEMEGLKMAFGNRQQKQFCAVGSVKSNMGHLTAASGIAGLIKTILAIRHRSIPASLHYKNPNPDINFIDSPFYVNNTLSDWQSDTKRLAGISSFGVGGTNVHVIVEEYEKLQQQTAKGRPLQLITWSAKSEESRDAYANKLIDYCNKQQGISFADFAYTLQTCRAEFNSRRFIVASGFNDLKEQLQHITDKLAAGKTLSEKVGGLVFIFPDENNIGINTGHELYLHEQAFKHAIDKCAAAWQQTTKENLLTLLYPTDAQGTNNNNLKHTISFVVNYALAELYMSWGIKVQAFTGSGTGKLVADCLAGTLALNNALTLAREQVNPTGEKSSEADKKYLVIDGFKNEPGSAYITVLNAVGELWINGVDVDWNAFYTGRQHSKINIPTYAFNRKRYWLTPGNTDQTIVPGALDPITPDNVELINKVNRLLEAASGIEMQGVSIDADFVSLGFDSLSLTQIAINLKKEFNVNISFRQLYEEYSTTALLLAFLEKKSPGVIASPKPVSAKADDRQERQITLTQEEAIETKKPFGAVARIERNATRLTQAQTAFLAELTKAYNLKTKASKEYTQAHRSYMADPRVVTGFKPMTKEIVYPIVVNKSKGSRVWDIDGNEYIDALNGFGANFLGYQPEAVKEAVKQQVEAGYEIGPQHELAGEVCKLICEFTGLDRSALCNTGSEAVLGAMRIARTVTGRSLIVAFNGSYHGINDEVIARGTKNAGAIPAAPGIMPESLHNMLMLDYGTEESLHILKQRAHELAAVLVEPVQSRRAEYQPIEFLKELRTLTHSSGTALIFDEVITGFRSHPGGVQALFGIKADLATYGKVIGGGMPIGVIAGSNHFMNALDGGAWQYGDESGPETGVTYFAGTFVRHPLALAASCASLNYMKEQGPALQETMNARTKRLADALNKKCVEEGLPIFIAQFSSLWKLKFTEDIPYAELLFTLMRYKGIHIWDVFPCFLSNAHTDKDVDTIIEKFCQSIDELIKAGFFKAGNKAGPAAKHNMHYFDEPPMPGAKLGRDENGNPAWFINDKDKSGKYIQIELNKN